MVVQADKVTVGSKAPDFVLVTNDLGEKSLADYAGKVMILSVVPSLDTGLCATQTRRFYEAAAGLGADVVILTISADLPFAQARWCGAEGIDQVETLSTHRDMKFSDDYGVHDDAVRLNRRSVFVVDKNDVVQHVEIMPANSEEVNYDAALAKARELG